MIIAIAALKGGAGKTLVTLHLAGEAFGRGLKVLVADADAQGSAVTWADVAAEAGRLGPRVVSFALPPRPGAALSSGSASFRPTPLTTALPPLASSHEITLIDCPPRGDVMTRSALMVADLVLFPAPPAPTDFWALASTVELFRQAQALRPVLRGAIVLNRIRPRQHLSSEARAGLKGLELPVLKTTLGDRTAFAESIALGQTVRTHSPKSTAADEIRRLLDELLEMKGAQ